MNLSLKSLEKASSNSSALGAKSKDSIKVSRIKACLEIGVDLYEDEDEFEDEEVKKKDNRDYADDDTAQ